MKNVICAFVMLALSSTPAHAIWAAVPLEILVDESDIIVVGKVNKIQDGGFAIGNRKYDVAVVNVSKILKSLVGSPTEVHIGQPAADGGIAVSTDIRFRPGQEAIWLLTKDPQRNVYWAKHPSQTQNVNKQKELTSLVAAREKLPSGKAVKGLVARAELVEHKSAKQPTAYEVRFSVKNVSKRSITICDYIGNEALQVKWIGPDGKMRKSNHYAWLALADIRALSKEDFVTLPPGGVRFIGPRGQHSGIWFQNQPSRHMNLAQPGQHRVSVSYANKEDGKAFGQMDVWQGTVTANEIMFKVK